MSVLEAGMRIDPTTTTDGGADAGEPIPSGTVEGGAARGGPPQGDPTPTGSTAPEPSPIRDDLGTASDPMIGATEIAEWLKINPRSLYRMIKRGSFPAPDIRRRKLWRWRRSRVQAWADSGTINDG